MTNLLPPLHNGHAPITLQQLFRDAVDAFEEWDAGAAEPVVIYEGTIVPVTAVFEAMRECTDILPNNLIGAITDRLTKPWVGSGPLDEMTFSTAARVLTVLSKKQVRSHGSGDISAFIQKYENDQRKGR